MDDNDNVTKMTLKNTVFIVEAEFSDDAKETACDKIKRLITDSLKFHSSSNRDKPES